MFHVFGLKHIKTKTKTQNIKKSKFRSPKRRLPTMSNSVAEILGGWQIKDAQNQEEIPWY